MKKCCLAFILFIALLFALTICAEAATYNMWELGLSNILLEMRDMTNWAPNGPSVSVEKSPEDSDEADHTEHMAIFKITTVNEGVFNVAPTSFSVGDVINYKWYSNNEQFGDAVVFVLMDSTLTLVDSDVVSLVGKQEGFDTFVVPEAGSSPYYFGVGAAAISDEGGAARGIYGSPEPASMVMLGLALLGTAVKKFTS